LATLSLLESEINSCLKEISAHTDPRHFAFRVSYEIREHEITLNGFVHFPQQEQALLSRLEKIPQVSKKNIAVYSQIKILAKNKLKFGQCRVAFANMYAHPKIDSERVSQVLYGSFLLCYFSHGQYIFCADPTGYLGYVRKADILLQTREDYLRWLNGRRARVMSDIQTANGLIPMGSELVCDEKNRLILPDGGVFQSVNSSIKVHEPMRHPLIKPLLKSAPAYLAVPYLWGGKTSAGIDCSTFVQVLFLIHGIALPRDSSQQVNVGYQTGMLGDFSDVLPGDLLFFMGRKGRIIHVGLSLGGEKFLHASVTGGVKESFIDEEETAGHPYRNYYVMARRILA